MPADVSRKRMLIQRVEELPSIPSTLTKIIQLAESESSNATDLAKIISQDQSLSSMILRIVNSAFYGHFRSITSISHSIVILGFQTVKSMALGASIYKLPPAGDRPAFDRNGLWIHALGVATLSKKLSLVSGSSEKPDPETSFISGFLHDIGKVVLDNCFSSEYRKAAEAARKFGELIRVMEEKTVGMDHAAAGMYLAQKWQFPGAVIDAISFHHNLGAATGGGGTVAAMVHLADFHCHRIELGSGGNFREPELDTRALGLCALSEAAVAGAVKELNNERAAIEALVIE